MKKKYKNTVEISFFFFLNLNFFQFNRLEQEGGGGKRGKEKGKIWNGFFAKLFQKKKNPLRPRMYNNNDNK